ncbi:uncharacterized protein A4U43_C01F28110 [Asparagus officinalis]|uniref:AAA+ ATPase domain-containing protein n=1 Tax=Asparagus officinalis TaxID=4686 RepID=A0A5P1FVY3_ASPOF|nr:protein HYPER-SENSITIVITY-RELATED 4-like [Asparagus officinalis]ONK81349.1 uncharacterized protein A4U43_C01F28110 [Asparagus officinalis]
MATDKPALLATAASIAASAVLIRTLTSDLLPSSIQEYLSEKFACMIESLSSDLTITVDEFDGAATNHMYKAAESYLATKLNPSTRHIRVSKQEEDTDIFEVTIDRGQEIIDLFEGIKFRWRSSSRDTKPRVNSYRGHYMEPTTMESKFFELKFHKKHKDTALKSYLPFVLSKAKAVKEEVKTLKLCTNDDYEWDSVNLHHPSTFETMALDAELKREVMEDLARFVKRKEYYKRVGKAWKRGYLLYGPPGTGKSSLVAAMANLLRFDIYNLELTAVRNNSQLRSLLARVANRSILVVEDIDCAVNFESRDKRKQLQNQEDSFSDSEDSKVTLSGLLNFVDGLWSSCGDERIIIFTTNYKDKLDPALLRPGRMDMHVHMNYCTPTGFRVLVSNYHSLDDHQLFGDIEGLINEVDITPAEVAEEMMKTDDAEVALQALQKVLKERKNKELKEIKVDKTEKEENKDH